VAIVEKENKKDDIFANTLKSGPAWIYLVYKQIIPLSVSIQLIIYH
jgi:hypothetical protein